MPEDKLSAAEARVVQTLTNSGIYLLNNSIIHFTAQDRPAALLSVSNMQTAMELLLKSYICRLYRFEDILLPKSQSVRRKNSTLYLQDLAAGRVKTIGFQELKQFLRERGDLFSPVIDEGCCPCFGLEYDYLEGCFDKFQSIRNAFFHLGIETSDADSRWLEADYFSMLTLFISLLLREIDALDRSSTHGLPDYSSTLSYLGDDMLWQTPMDLLQKHLSPSAIAALRQNSLFMNSLYDFAADAYHADGYTCSRCGRETLFLDVFDGFSKCVNCGDVFMAGYTDCPVCQSEHTVIFDQLNIAINQNILPGFCFSCAKHPKVYQCPVCGLVYPYSSHHPIAELRFPCCKKHFRDREIEAFYDC